MKNLLHVVNIYFVIPYFLGEQLNYFGKKGYKEFIVCSHSDEIKECAVLYDFEYKEVCILRTISILKDLIALISISKYIREKKIDVVTGHTPKGALIAMLAAFLTRVPKRIYFRHGLVYETSHGFKRMLLLSMDRIAALFSTKVVCVSPSVYRISLKDKLNSEKKQVLLSKGTCNGIDVNRFNRQSLDLAFVEKLKKQYNICQGEIVIGYVGRLVKDKGIIELISAFHQIQNQCPNVKLLLVGMLEERDAIPIQVVNEIYHNPCIIYTGYVDNGMIENYYALMDVFVLLSYREGFPTSVLEASSMKLPIVTTKVTGCVDSIIENETGIFVMHDELDVASAIKGYIDDADLRSLHGEAGRRFVEANFEQLVIWKEIEKLYQ